MRQVQGGLYVWDRLRSVAEYAALDRQFRDLRSLDLHSASNRELREALHALGRGYATRTMHVLPQGPFTTFRASRPTTLDQPWNHIRDLWAPPATYVARGRFNDVHKPVLYVSSDPHTALMEVQPKPYEVRVVLLLRKRAPEPTMHFAQIGFQHLPTFYAAQENLREVRGGIRAEPQLKAFLDERGIFEYWAQQDSYLSEICAREYAADEAEDAYRLTFEIARQLQKMRHVDGIHYPTVANDYRGLNLAIPVGIARLHFAPIQAWLFQFGANIDPPGGKGRRYDGVVTRIGSFEPNGVLIWSSEGRWSTDDLHYRWHRRLTGHGSARIDTQRDFGILRLGGPPCL